MASNDDSEPVTARDDEYDTGYLEVEGGPHISPINNASLDTVEKLRNELEKYKKVNEQLRGQIYKMNRNMLLSEKKFQKEKALLEFDRKDERMRKENKIEVARVKMEELSKRTKDLLVKIKEYENSIKVLEKNEKELLKKLSAFKDTETNELIASESRKTESTENELLRLKQRVQDMTIELEEKQKFISKILSDLSKTNEKLDRMDIKVDDMAQMMRQLLRKVDAPPNGSKDEPVKPDQVLNRNAKAKNQIQAREKTAEDQVPGRISRVDAIGSEQQPTNTPRSLGTKLPPISSPRSNAQQKPRWQYTGGSMKK